MRLPLLLLALLPLVAAAHDAGPAHAGVQSLDITRSGSRLHLLLGETANAEAKPVLNHRWSSDDGATWSQPVRVDTDNVPAAGLHRGMDAQITASGDYLIAVWQTAGTDSWGGGPMTTALSSDAGKTWMRGPNPADDGSTEGHNFIDITTDGTGAFHLVWLDTREGKRGLRSAISTDHGKTWSANHTVDAETCECCWNTVTGSPEGGAWVIYRDKAPRDMAAAFLPLTAQPNQPVTVGRFAWEFPGCPHVGAGLCLAPNGTLHAAVWSGKDQRSGTYYLRSEDRGAHWSEPHSLGDTTTRNPDCAAGTDDSVAITWNAVVNDTLSVHAAVSKDGGQTWSKSSPLSSTGSNATHPRIIATANGFRVFWSESGTWKSAQLQKD